MEQKTQVFWQIGILKFHTWGSAINIIAIEAIHLPLPQSYL
jgi:hypothetical protein